MPEVTVARTDALRDGTGKVVEVDGHTLAVFLVEGVFYVIDNTCLHRGGPLGEGFLEGTTVTCPWHGWEYDLRTGENTFQRRLAVRTYPVTVAEGEVRVEL